MNIVVVTACLAGVAHSKMAAAALKKEGSARGYNMYIEEQGGHKITKKLSQEEIENADVVIIANAIAISKGERFEGKPILQLPINKVLRDVKGTMDKAIALIQE